MSARQRQGTLPAHATRFACSSLAQSTPATALSAFPSMVSELKGSETVLTGLLADRPRCSASLRTSRRSASNCSNFDKSGRDRHRVIQAMTAQRNRAHHFRSE